MNEIHIGRPRNPTDKISLNDTNLFTFLFLEIEAMIVFNSSLKTFQFLILLLKKGALTSL